jgi:predicted DNA-binding helix-hairpin-helix protein
MAADYAKLIAQLRSFYDFTAKAVLLVGAGGGQLLDPTVKPKKLIAIDHDRDAQPVTTSPRRGRRSATSPKS